MLNTSVEPVFIWNDKEVINHRHVMEAVLDIVRLHQEGYDVGYMAAEFIDDYGTFLEHLIEPTDDGRKVAQDNIGYMAADESREIRDLIFDLFACEHPIFGRTEPTPIEAFEAGKRFAHRYPLKTQGISNVSYTKQD